jgi:Family of unknown function (DUF6495)
MKEIIGMKYRRLTINELEELQQEFVLFLAGNSITGDDWVRMKENDPKKSDEFIDIFSDLIFEKILKKVEHLEFKTAKDMKLFHCLEDKIVMMGLFVEGHSNLDFSKPADPVEMLEQLKNSSAQLKLYQAEKQFSKQREMELFEMMENGCLISKGELFHTLQQLKGEED